MKRLVVSLAIIMSVQFSKAQELESVLLAADDASLLLTNYLNPAMKGLMFSMNDGWATTAKVHKKFGFDITIGVNASIIPNAAKTFAFIPSEYTVISLPNGETELQTIISDNSAEATVDISVPIGDGTYKIGNFTMPGGIAKDLPLSVLPAPTVQVGFGLPFKTDIKARFVPSISFDEDVKVKLLGFGVQHDVMQYFGALRHLPLSLSVLGGFTTMDVVYDIIDDDGTNNLEIKNGKTAFELNSWTAQALASLDFKLITVYGGVGYSNGKTSVKLKGDYSLTYAIEDDQGNYLGTVNEAITDPINLSFAANGMRATLGTRLNLGVFKIFADYTFQEYDTATLGFSISVR